MKLNNPITVTPPAITKTDGTIKTFNPIVLDTLNFTIMDNAENKSVLVQVHPVPRPLILWSGEAYDAAGDYTQAQVESKILELLGDDPSKTLEALFMAPMITKKE